MSKIRPKNVKTSPKLSNGFMYTAFWVISPQHMPYMSSFLNVLYQSTIHSNFAVFVYIASPFKNQKLALIGIK